MGAQDNPPGDRLVPLPRRAADASDLVQRVAASPVVAVAALLERTNHLLTQLEADVDHLRRDREEERQQIEAECEQRQRAADAAVGDLDELAALTRELAERKARTDVLDEALRRPVRLDESVAFP